MYIVSHTAPGTLFERYIVHHEEIRFIFISSRADFYALFYDPIKKRGKGGWSICKHDYSIYGEPEKVFLAGNFSKWGGGAVSF